MSITESARSVLRANDRGGFTIPSAKLYPYQWNWDSVFVALGFADFDTDRAWTEIETLFDAQWPSGMVPHIIFRSDEPTYFPGPSVWKADHGKWPSSGISQPPVAASVVRTLLESNQLPYQAHRAAALLPKLDQWHRWWHAARDPDDLGVIAVTHPWESGRDNLPDWDEPAAAIEVGELEEYRRRDLELVDAAMRPHKDEYDRYLSLVAFGAERNWEDDRISSENQFFVADPAITAILLRAERDLLAMTEQLGGDASAVSERIDKMEAGFDRLWNPDVSAYCSIDLRSGKLFDATTSASFLAPYAGVTTHHEEVMALLSQWSDHCSYLVPSFDPRHEGFEPLRYWRGPVWAVVNYLVGIGLADVGETEWANRVRVSTREMIEAGGFAEYFDPLSGRGCGGDSFSWTAAIWLAWASKDAT